MNVDKTEVYNTADQYTQRILTEVTKHAQAKVAVKDKEWKKAKKLRHSDWHNDHKFINTLALFFTQCFLPAIF